MRADQALVARGLASSRSAAQRLIADGAVRLAQGPILRKPSHLVSELDDLQVDASDETRFVSRAGAKLDHALTHFGIDPAGLEILDLGQSTGGFTDCLLQRGASRVVGIEVGHGQLHERLRRDPRVVCIERTNLRDLDRPALQARIEQVCGMNLQADAAKGNGSKDIGPEGNGRKGTSQKVNRPKDPGCMPGFNMAVADLSFISLAKVLPAINRLLEPQACVLMLVKPQFELGPSALDSKGIVKSESLARTAVDLIAQSASELGWQVLGCTESVVRGTDGNLEFFLNARTRESGNAQGS